MRFRVTVEQVFTRKAVVEVEAQNDLAAMDCVEHLPESEFKWGDLDTGEPTATDARLLDTRNV